MSQGQVKWLLWAAKVYPSATYAAISPYTPPLPISIILPAFQILFFGNSIAEEQNKEARRNPASLPKMNVFIPQILHLGKSNSSFPQTYYRPFPQ